MAQKCKDCGTRWAQEMGRCRRCQLARMNVKAATPWRRPRPSVPLRQPDARPPTVTVVKDEHLSWWVNTSRAAFVAEIAARATLMSSSQEARYVPFRILL